MPALCLKDISPSINLSLSGIVATADSSINALLEWTVLINFLERSELVFARKFNALVHGASQTECVASMSCRLALASIVGYVFKLFQKRCELLDIRILQSRE